MVMDVGTSEPAHAEADLASVLHHIWREKHKDLDIEMAALQGKGQSHRSAVNTSVI